MQTAAQESLNLTMNRNVGMHLGSILQGTFTLIGSGPEAVQNLTVYFNGDEVHFVTGNSISWHFDTADYPSGSTNITLFGVDDVGTTYLATRQVTFIGGAASNIFTIVVIGLVAVLVLAKYGSRLMGLRKAKPRPS